MKRLMFAMAACAVALSACAPQTGVSTNGTFTNGTAAVTQQVTDQVVLRSTTALSLGELAFASAEEGATAALRSNHLPPSSVRRCSRRGDTAIRLAPPSAPGRTPAPCSTGWPARLPRSTPSRKETDMADLAAIAAAIENDVNLAVDLFAKITGNIAAAKEVLASNPDASVVQQIADARAKLATIQQSAAAADADFDAALQAAQAA